MDHNCSIYELLKRILNELNTQVVDHGERVAFLELMMARGRNRKDDLQLENLMLACFAHDIGAYKTDKFLNLLKFDAENTLEHCIYGYLFMKYFSPLKEDAEVLLYHHTFHKEKDSIDSPYFHDGVLIHMLDRVDVLNISCGSHQELLDQLTEHKGDIFNPEDVDDFIRFNEEMHILERLENGSYRDEVRAYFDNGKRTERLLEPIINMLAFEVDFKSEQTVIHTVTTALIGKCLAQKLGLSEKETEELFLASKIHDLGKINVPTEILEKPGKLTDEEYELIKTHSEGSKRIASDLFPENIVNMAYHHHERMDGSGYPVGLTEDSINLQEKILQVADVASALIYKRSYKKALEKDRVIAILTEEKNNNKLSRYVIDEFIARYDEIMEFTTDNSREIIDNYESLQSEYRKYMTTYSMLNHESDSIGSFTIGGLRSSAV